MKRNILAALVAFTASAFAGARISQPVFITDFGGGYKRASGALGTARNSADTIQYIQCEAYGYETWSSVYCYARTETAYASCYIRESDEMKKPFYGMSQGSYISFTNSPSDIARCSELNVRTSSRNEPPAP